MTAGKYNTDLDIGATWSRTITWKDAGGVLVDLSGYTAKMQLRNFPGSTVIVELISTGLNPYIILGGAAGTIALTLPDTATDLLTPGVAKYDLFLLSPTGIETKLLEGVIQVNPRITV